MEMFEGLTLKDLVNLGLEKDIVLMSFKMDDEDYTTYLVDFIGSTPTILKERFIYKVTEKYAMWLLDRGILEYDIERMEKENYETDYLVFSGKGIYTIWGL